MGNKNKNTLKNTPFLRATFYILRRRPRSGQGLVEALIGISIIALGVSLATIIAFGGQDILVDRFNTLDAQTLAQEGILGAKAIIGEDWGAVVDGTYGLNFQNGKWQFVATSSDIHGSFAREITVTTPESNKKEIKSRVLWQKPSAPREVELVTIITNWRTVLETCGLEGDWSSLQTLGSFSIVSSREITDVKTKGNYLYLTSVSANAGDFDFDIWDVSDPENPSFVASLDTGEGLSSLDIQGGYAFVVGSDDIKELQVIDISDPRNPFVAATFDSPGSADHLAIKTQGSFAYVGTEKSEGSGNQKHEFRVFNVSDPLNPSLAGSREVDHDVNDLAVEGTLVYAAIEYTAPELRVIDVSDPANPTFTQTFDEKGDGVGKSVHAGLGRVNSGRFFLGRSEDVQQNKKDNDEPEFYILDPDPGSSNIPAIGSYNVDGSVFDTDVACETAFLATTDSSATFMVLDISTPSAPTLLSSLGIGNTGKALDYSGNKVYFATENTVRIITSSD